MTHIKGNPFICNECHKTVNRPRRGLCNTCYMRAYRAGLLPIEPKMSMKEMWDYFTSNPDDWNEMKQAIDG